MHPNVAILFALAGVALYITVFRTFVWLRGSHDPVNQIGSGFSALTFLVVSLHLGRYLAVTNASILVCMRAEASAIYAMLAVALRTIDATCGAVRSKVLSYASLAFVGFVTVLIWNTDFVVDSTRLSGFRNSALGPTIVTARGAADFSLTLVAGGFLATACRGLALVNRTESPERWIALRIVLALAGLTIIADSLVSAGITSFEFFPYSLVACAAVFNLSLVWEHARLYDETDALVKVRTRELEAERAQLVHVAADAEAARDRAEASEQEARQAAGLLQQADRLASIGTLAAGTAHEINNPLTFVGGNIEVISMYLSQDELSSDIRAVLRDAISDARRGVGRIAQIVKDLHDFAIPNDSGLASIGLQEIADAGGRLAKATLKRHGTTLAHDYQAAPRVMADEQRLTQVVVNVLINAAQAIAGDPASVARGATVTLRITERDGRAVLEILDDGPGIPEDMLARVFDPFFTTKEIGEGAGLGLAVCHGIVRSLGGAIEAANRPEGGAVFTIALPAEPAAA